MQKKYHDCARADELSGLLHERISRKMSQKELAEKSGVNIRQIQRYESAESDIGNMTLKNAIAIADALGCEVRDLL